MSLEIRLIRVESEDPTARARSPGVDVVGLQKLGDKFYAIWELSGKVDWHVRRKLSQTNYE
jgi:hypothetical protein